PLHLRGRSPGGVGDRRSRRQDPARCLALERRLAPPARRRTAPAGRGRLRLAGLLAALVGGLLMAPLSRALGWVRRHLWLVVALALVHLLVAHLFAAPLSSALAPLID